MPASRTDAAMGLSEVFSRLFRRKPSWTPCCRSAPTVLPFNGGRIFLELQRQPATRTSRGAGQGSDANAGVTWRGSYASCQSIGKRCHCDKFHVSVQPAPAGSNHRDSSQGFHLLPYCIEALRNCYLLVGVKIKSSGHPSTGRGGADGIIAHSSPHAVGAS